MLRSSSSHQELSVISDGVLLCGYVIVGRHVIPEVKKVNMAVMYAFTRPLSTYKHFCPIDMLRLYQS
jgi:hypothetical protein